MTSAVTSSPLRPAFTQNAPPRALLKTPGEPPATTSPGSAGSIARLKMKFPLRPALLRVHLLSPLLLLHTPAFSVGSQIVLGRVGVTTSAGTRPKKPRPVPQ